MVSLQADPWYGYFSYTQKKAKTSFDNLREYGNGNRNIFLGTGIREREQKNFFRERECGNGNRKISFGNGKREQKKLFPQDSSFITHTVKISGHTLISTFGQREIMKKTQWKYYINDAFWVCDIEDFVKQKTLLH